MPTYEHTWDEVHGHHTKVVFDDSEFISEIKFRTRCFTNFLAFTVNEEFYKWLDSAEPEQRIDELREFYQQIGDCQFTVVLTIRQYDKCVVWTNKNDLEFYCRWYVKPFAKHILREQGRLS